MNGEHHITIPNHKDLRLGLVNTILNDIAEHIGISQEELVVRIIGK